MKSLFNYSPLHGYTVNNKLSYSQKKDMLINLKKWSKVSSTNWIKRTHLTTLKTIENSKAISSAISISDKMFGLVGLLVLSVPIFTLYYVMQFPLSVPRGVSDSIIINRLNKKQGAK
jgi:hypothetical protein